MSLCGQVYSLYICLWKCLEGYRTNLKVSSVTRSIEEVLQTGFPKSIYTITDIIET